MKKTLEISDITKDFILRRTTSCIEDCLGSKLEMIVHCKLSQSQEKAYQNYIEKIQDSIDKNENFEKGSTILSSILHLRKIAHSVQFLKSVKDISQSKPLEISDFINNSGKLHVLVSILSWIKKNTTEKIVIGNNIYKLKASNFTTTLDEIQQMLDFIGYQYSRLDGSTAQEKRQG